MLNYTRKPSIHLLSQIDSLVLFILDRSKVMVSNPGVLGEEVQLGKDQLSPVQAIPAWYLMEESGYYSYVRRTRSNLCSTEMK